MLLSNFLAQAEGLMKGRDSDEVRHCAHCIRLHYNIPNRCTRLENLAWSHSVFIQFSFCKNIEI